MLETISYQNQKNIKNSEIQLEDYKKVIINYNYNI